MESPGPVLPLAFTAGVAGTAAPTNRYNLPNIIKVKFSSRISANLQILKYLRHRQHVGQGSYKGMNNLRVLLNEPLALAPAVLTEFCEAPVSFLGFGLLARRTRKVRRAVTFRASFKSSSLAHLKQGAV